MFSNDLQFYYPVYNLVDISKSFFLNITIILITTYTRIQLVVVDKMECLINLKG